MYKFLKRFGFYNPISIVFDQATADANKGDTDGGKTDPDANKGGGGGDTKEPAKDQTFELTVDGEKRTVTLDEMKNLAQKANGADKKFQDASELRKQAEDGLRMKDLIGRLSDSEHEPTELEVKELAGMIGVDPNEFAQYLKEGDTEGTTSKKGTTDTTGKIDKQSLVEALGFDPAEAKAILDYSKQRHIDSARQQIKETSDNAVDKDEIFGKMVIGENGKDRLAVIKDLVAEDVLRRIQDGVPFGAELVAASVQKIRAHLTKFGIPNKPDVFPLTLGLGPGGGLPSEIQSEKPITRVSAGEEGAEDNFVSRAMQKGLQLLRNKGKQ